MVSLWDFNPHLTITVDSNYLPKAKCLFDPWSFWRQLFGIWRVCFLFIKTLSQNTHTEYINHIMHYTQVFLCISSKDLLDEDGNGSNNHQLVFHMQSYPGSSNSLVYDHRDVYDWKYATDHRAQFVMSEKSMLSKFFAIKLFFLFFYWW